MTSLSFSIQLSQCNSAGTGNGGNGTGNGGQFKREILVKTIILGFEIEPQ